MLEQLRDEIKNMLYGEILTIIEQTRKNMVVVEEKGNGD